MTGFWIELAILLLGFGAAALLFWRIPRLPKKTADAAGLRVSVVIPARNEETTLPLLLLDLLHQSFAPFEIIVADDGSEDRTAQTARSFGVEVLSLPEKSADWIGKSWACQQGARAARGDVFVFLDADVRLAPDGLSRVVSAYLSLGTVSVQPYHAPQKPYEQCAVLFNLIQVAAIGSALPTPVNLGLFGPVIAISREDYFAAGGHESVKSSVVEDMAFAETLRRGNIPYSVFVGDEGVSFRMYPGGFGHLWQGFTKNLATGASKIPAWLFFLVLLFLASVISAALHLILSLTRGESLALLYGALYALWAAVLFLLGRRVGRFSVFTFLLYPLPLAVYLLIFIHSGILRVFRVSTKWKGRAIRPGK